MSEPVRAVLIGVAATVGLAMVWLLAGPLLTIFAGLLVAALLDAIVRGIRRVVPLPQAPLVIVVSLAIVGLTATGLSFGGMGLWRSVDELVQMLRLQAGEIYQQLASFGSGSDLLPDDPGAMLADFMPSSAGVFSSAQFLFGSTMGLVSNAVVIVFLGIFFALAPGRYRDGLLRMVPASAREEARRAMDGTGHTLRGWLVTQMVTMMVVGTLMGGLLLALGVPNAILLGVLAGLLNFVPFLGPLFSAVPVLMTLATQDMTTLIIGVGGLLLIQNLEGYVLTPMLQARIISLPPAWSLCMMLVMGALFGLPGVALATPLFAVIRSLTLSLYVEPQRAGAGPPLEDD
ncbi:AI-2E family transporter [Devosia sp. BSSL-BM10]|uniref:AI-2E family transporter n=1 Tax=Devosia litorisediminis TaxID=2829817 RepID=A0A942I7P3_9HYPH|nr:AI-2E family transporter [Devosia litorisediminis]MBS3850388.1 AI-2E family transporter [Devosia litorisediminis]